MTTAPAVAAASTAPQHSIVPAPHAVSVGVTSTSASVSPSPFAPPPTSAPIVGPVSQSLLPSSSSSPHPTAKAKSPAVVQVHPDRQVCPSSRTILLSACVYAYVLCDRVQCFRRWILPIAPRHHAPPIPHGVRRGLLCSFLPRLRVTRSLAPGPALRQKNPTHQMSYPSIRHRHRRLHQHRRRRRRVDLVAVMYKSSPRPVSKDKDGN
jgi:hypothetical protein